MTIWREEFKIDSSIGGKKFKIEIDSSIWREEIQIEIDSSIWREEIQNRNRYLDLDYVVCIEPVGM